MPSPIHIKGFTLVEMLVVLLVMGLLAGLVGVIAQPDTRSRLHIEAERLAQLLNLAAEESRMAGKSIRWSADGAGYRFLRLQGDLGWTEIRDNDLLRPRSLPQGMVIAGLWNEALRPQEAMRLQFAPYGMPAAYTIRLTAGAAQYTVAASPVSGARVLQDEGRAHDPAALR